MSTANRQLLKKCYDNRQGGGSGYRLFRLALAVTHPDDEAFDRMVGANAQGLRREGAGGPVARCGCFRRISSHSVRLLGESRVGNVPDAVAIFGWRVRTLSANPFCRPGRVPTVTAEVGQVCGPEDSLLTDPVDFDGLSSHRARCW